MVLNQELTQEFVRLALVYIHLIACCLCIGLVLTSDASMAVELYRQRGSQRPLRLRDMDAVQGIVANALAVLWATGAAIIALDAATKGGWQYFANPKLQAKILVVALLTANGLALHGSVLPWLKKAGSLLRLSFSQTVVALLAGVVSGVSWMYAAFMGVGRPLAWKYSLLQLMAAYPVLIAGGFMGMFMLTMWCKYPEFATTEFSPQPA